MRLFPLLLASVLLLSACGGSPDVASVPSAAPSVAASVAPSVAPTEEPTEVPPTAVPTVAVIQKEDMG